MRSRTANGNRNMYVHGVTAGRYAPARKEGIQRFIEDQLEMGEEGLDERDHYMLEINLEDLETLTEEDHQYCLLQIKADRCDLALQRQNNDSINGNHRVGERA